MSNTAPSATGKETSAAADVASSSSVLSVPQQSTDSSSQALNSQGNALQCSESLVSSVSSDNSQSDSQPTSADSAAVLQGPVKDGNTQGTRLETPRADAGPDKAASNTESKASASTLPFTPQTNPVDKTPAPASNGFHYSPGFLATSNLSQLAELAANKSAMNQVSSNSTQLPAQPVQPHVLGNQSRFVLPSQGMPPPMFGPYPSGPMMHMQGQYQGFPPAPPQVPPPFVKGSIIQLATGDLKRVEDLTTEDFIHSTRLCPDLKLETSTVVKIEDGSDSGSTHITFTINSSKIQVILNCPVEHPFFVYGQGWTSGRPEQSLTKYNLTCQHLKVGDVCIFLSPSNPSIFPAGVALPSGPTTQVSGGNSTPTQSVPGVLPSAAKTSAVSSGTSQSATSVSVSYAQTLAGMATLPGNMPGVVVTSSMPPGIPAVYPGTFPQSQSIGQGKASAQSATDRSAPPTQPVQGVVYTSDGKPSDPPHSTAAVPGGFPLPSTSYYQPLAGTFMTAMPPGQTFVQGTVMPQGSVGNGLLVAAVGFVPGRPPAPFVQPGMLYGTSPMEMLPKGADGKPEEHPHKGRTDTQAELSQPDAKRAKGETEVK